MLDPDVLDRVRVRFGGDTAEHELSVIVDNGLYRHLRCMKPGTYIYGFDVVTWPGYLAVVGDCGDYVFSRVRDMFEFFESDSGRINPDYWSEKLQAPRPAGARSYSHDAFCARVREWGRQQCEDWYLDGEEVFVYPALMAETLDREILYGYTHSEHEARERLELLEEEVGYIETWEWNFDDFEPQFLWCCHAIVWAVQRYRATKAVAA